MIDSIDIDFTAWYAHPSTHNHNDILAQGVRHDELVDSAHMHEIRSSVSVGFLTRTQDNRININDFHLANTIRALVAKEGVAPDDPYTIARAHQMIARQAQPSIFPYTKPTFGYVAEWLSEVGEPGDLDALLRHADAYLKPSWLNSGLYYTSCDADADADGNWTFMDPFTGNAAIGYARLNVPDGQKVMWEHPWTKEDLASRPWIDNVSMDSGVDTVRGAWDTERQMMVASLRTWDGRSAQIKPVIRNLVEGLYGVYVDGALVEKKEVNGREDVVAVELKVAGKEVDLVVLKSRLPN